MDLSQQNFNNKLNSIIIKNTQALILTVKVSYVLTSNQICQESQKIEAFGLIPFNLNQKKIYIQSLNILSKMSYFYYYPLNTNFAYTAPQYNSINTTYDPSYLFNSQLNQNYLFQQHSAIVPQNEAQVSQNQIQRPENSIPSQGNDIVKKQQKIKKRRGIDKEKQLQSAKKNSESNIINQFFSFFSSRTQSDEIVERAVLMSVAHIEDLQKITSIFYNVIKCMSIQRVKKYVNKKTLMNVFEKENIEKEIPQILQKFQKLGFVTIDEVCQIIRRCCLFFLRSTSLISILSSKRISSVSKYQHLKKRRHIANIACGKV